MQRLPLCTLDQEPPDPGSPSAQRGSGSLLEQPVQSQDNEDEGDCAEQLRNDAETEKRLMSGDVVGRRSGVASHDQGVGNIDEAKGGG